MTQHYRLKDVHTSNGIEIRIEKFDVIKETEKGYWVASQYAPTCLDFKQMKDRKFVKWVSKTSGKRLCYPSIELAIDSFKKRKNRQKAMLKYQFEQAHLCVSKLDNLDGLQVSDFNGGFLIGRTPSHGDFVFDW